MYSRHHAFLFPSLHDAGGMVILEAWAHGLPTVSAVDPDGIVTREKIGEVATDLAGLEACLARWMADPARCREAGDRARAYVAERHSPARIVDQVASVLDGVIRRVRDRRA